MADREARLDEARDIAQEAAEAGLPPLHYMLHTTTIEEQDDDE